MFLETPVATVAARRTLAQLLINGHVLSRARDGSAPRRPASIEHVLISHAHLDHTVGLAFSSTTSSRRSRVGTPTAASIVPVVDDLRSYASTTG
jgi:ribonuclease BN (tRNA processing enzyme)